MRQRWSGSIPAPDGVHQSARKHGHPRQRRGVAVAVGRTLSTEPDQTRIRCQDDQVGHPGRRESRHPSSQKPGQKADRDHAGAARGEAGLRKVNDTVRLPGIGDGQTDREKRLAGIKPDAVGRVGQPRREGRRDRISRQEAAVNSWPDARRPSASGSEPEAAASLPEPTSIVAWPRLLLASVSDDPEDMRREPAAEAGTSRQPP